MKTTDSLFVFLLIILSCTELSLNSVPIVQAISNTTSDLEKQYEIPFYSAENFSIIVLPDTQYYSQRYPSIFKTKHNGSSKIFNQEI